MADFVHEKEKLLARISLVDVVDALGLERRGKVARCPAHDDQGRANLQIYDDGVHCFACGFHADAFDLVAKVKGVDFKGAFDFLAGRYGLPLTSDYRKSGAKPRAKVGGEATVVTKAIPLPDSPSPTLTPTVAVVDQGVDQGVAPWPIDFSPAIVDRYQVHYDGLPVSDEEYFALWGEVDRLVEKPGLTTVEGDWFRWISKRVGYEGPIPVAGDGAEATQATRRPSLRVQVFADLLGFTVPGSTTEAGLWIQREKGISPATLDAFGVSWLEDLRAAYAELRKRYGADTLERFGLLTSEGKSPFASHRLLFPFFWKGQPVDAQGRNVKATDKNQRFRNTGGTNPIPYNADALLQARETGKPVFLCEGATDTLTLAQSGRLAVGIVGVGGFKPAWLPYFDGLKVFLAFDGDDAGRKAAHDVTAVFVSHGHQAPRVIKLPDGVKDVNELFRGSK